MLLVVNLRNEPYIFSIWNAFSLLWQADSSITAKSPLSYLLDATKKGMRIKKWKLGTTATLSWKYSHLHIDSFVEKVHLRL